MLSKQYRLNRLLHPKSKRCLDIAVDHGSFNQGSFLAGIEHMPTAIEMLVAAGPDAIQMTSGMARFLQNVPGKNKPALVMRSDTANAYSKTLPHHVFSETIAEPALQAVRLDASCVVVNLLNVPGQPELYHDSIRNITSLRAECLQYGMPLMIEPLIFKTDDPAGAYMVDGDPEKIIPLVRQAVELGADVIKADPTDDPNDYHKVIETAAGVPVLVRGGGRVEDRILLERTRVMLDQGASGIVYGRNIYQHENPAGMTAALMAMLHENASVEQAEALIKSVK